MVEFGLKLEDNKVDQWSDKYIDYEKLKSVLKRAKASAARRDEHIKELPESVVAEVVKRRKDRTASAAPGEEKNASKPGGGTPDFDDTPAHPRVVYPFEVSQKKASSSSLPISENNATDSTPLLADREGMKRSGSWGRNVNQAMKTVTSYLGLADHREILMKDYDDVDDKLSLFKETYEQEVNKVKDFYDDKAHEISEQMDVLQESVYQSGLNIKKPKPEKKGSIVDTMTHRFERMMHGVSLRSIPTPTGDYEMDIHFSESLDELEGKKGDEIETKEKKEEILRKSDSIKRAITDIYRTSKLLHNFSIMNYTGFVKIAKKFDKTFKDHKGEFKGNNCDDGKQAEVLAARMEEMYSKWFCDGNIREAQAQMLPKRGDGLLMDWTQLRLGYRLGMCSILAMWVAWDCVWGQFAHGQVSIGGRSAFPVFRACFGLLTWHWFWGMAVYVWNRYRINYIYLFEFDPRVVDTPIDIFNDAVDETLVFLIIMLMYYKADAGDMPLWIPPRAYPSFLILYTIKCLIFPWKMRRPLWIAIRQVISAPFVSPTFFLTFVGDVFTSMVKVFQDILWTICFVASGDFLLSETDPTNGNVHAWTQQFWYKHVAIPLVCVIPLWIRFNQCLRRYFDTGKAMPNLANAFKYALSQSVTLFGAFHPLYLMQNNPEEHSLSLIDDAGDDDRDVTIVIGRYRSNWFQIFWMGLFVTSSLYSFCWDVYMDWGLGRREYGFLGPRLMFPKKSQYYSVICVDLVLRFMWVLTLVPPQSGAKFELPAYLSAITMTVELFRRTIWSFFRLEHEHRQNTSGFRRVNVVPLHFNTGHKHKYHERHWVGWKVLVEIVIVTSVVVAISAFSVIAAQRATANQVQLSNPTSHAKEL